MGLGLLLEFEFINGRFKTGCGLSWILENDTNFREQASGLLTGFALSATTGGCKMEMTRKRSWRE